MNDPALNRRCAMAIFFAALVATGVGLLAWGPVPLGADHHRYADMRTLLGIPNGWNVLVNLPLLAIGLLGLWVEQRSSAPLWLRRSRQAFHVAVAAGAVFAAAYHLNPSDTLYLAAQAALAAGFLVVTAAMLGERVHPVLAGPLVLVAAGGVALVAALASSLLGGDLRPLLLAQLVPLLVVPTGAIGLPGSHTRAMDWLMLLVLYGAARLLDAADAQLLAITGFVSGHTLMHLGFALAALWLVYCATRSPMAPTGADATQRPTSLHTAG